MKPVLIAVISAVSLLAACAPKPTETDVAAVLAENMPKGYKALVDVEQTQAEMSGTGDESLVKFKARLKLKQSLYEPTNFDAAAKAAGADPALFGDIEKAAQGLTVAGREAMAAAIATATAKPLILAESAPAGTAADWYGSFRVKKLVDKWIASEFKTDIEPKFQGRPRSEFPETALEGAKAAAWFSDIKVQQATLMQKIETALQLEKKDAENSQALAQKESELAQARAVAQREQAAKDAEASQALAQKESELAQARTVARREQAAKEALISQQQKQARQLPVRLSTRKAMVGGTLVLRIEVPQAMTLRLEAVRGLQTFARDLQVAPGRPVEVGHLEGWGFKSGDSVRLSNPSFDPATFTLP